MSADFRTAFRTRLLANATLASETGSRVYPLKLPQDTAYPAVTYQKISDLTEPNLADVSRIKRVRMQVDTWADTALKSWELADLVRDQLDGFKGVVDGIQMTASLIDSESDLFEDAIEKYRVTTDYELVYWAN